MITLYAFGPNFGLPDPSPPCMKAHVLLKMAGLPYTLDRTGLRKAPKGKLPYIDDNGTIVPDSTFIRWHIEKRTGFDFDVGLDDVQRADAWAYEKLCEDNLYYANGYFRWLVPENFERGPATFFNDAPAVIRPIIKFAVQRSVKSAIHKQGTGRHSADEITRLATRGIDSIAAKLGDKPWLMGDQPCGADASVHAAITSILCPKFDTPIRTAAERHPNLVAYRDRGLARWFPELSA
ncbi:MAG: glutathione S-transferase family protein [Hyphomicrobiaceae bacterium]|nr:glutathione S-transferase family protein [Hyphomicrobiaceae bacterium]